MCDSLFVFPLPKLGHSLFTPNWRSSFQTINDIVIPATSYSSLAIKDSNFRRSTLNASRNEEFGFDGELGFKEKGNKHFEFNGNRNDSGKLEFDSSKQNGTGPSVSTNSSALDFTENGEENKKKSEGSSMDEDLVPFERNRDDFISNKVSLRKGKQMMRRSSMVAKQVISVESALSLGFISQLWVDTTSWVVLVVEVKPNLLSGDSERFLLEDINQVGDVVLVEDESVVENDFKMVGLETLVGYKVITPGRRTIGKVRGYTFNIVSGAIESLELDSFGISIIPSSLVSTYAMLVEDVLEVVSDTVVVHEAAASRLQRLTKGFWDAQNVGTSVYDDDLRQYSDFERSDRFERNPRTRRSSTRKKVGRKIRETEEEEDWELPLDYL